MLRSTYHAVLRKEVQEDVELSNLPLKGSAGWVGGQDVEVQKKSGQGMTC